MTLAEPTVPPAPPVAPAAAAKVPEHNRLNLDFRQPMPRPPVRGPVIDWHCHLVAARHGRVWFEAADHYGISHFLTMTPLEEALGLKRDWPGRVQFVAVPRWQEWGPDWAEQWLRRIEAFYNLGSRVAKFHASPGTMAMRQLRLDSPKLRPILREVADRGMAIMTHVGDPDTWYGGKYAADPAKFGTRQEHYQMWESVLAEFPNTPWVGAHLGGNPEDLPRLQRMLDRYPNLMLDCSATRWMVREISLRREEARGFFIRNVERLLFGTDQVSGDDRGFDFLASRFWTHRKLWETGYIGPCPILDPDLPADRQPTMRGLALPTDVLQKLYHDNAANLLRRLGCSFE